VQFVTQFVLKVEIDMDSATAVDKEKCLHIDNIEIVPLTRDTDGSCTTQYVCGDLSAESKQGWETDDVCCDI